MTQHSATVFCAPKPISSRVVRRDLEDVECPYGTPCGGFSADCPAMAHFVDLSVSRGSARRFFVVADRIEARRCLRLGDFAHGRGDV